MSLPSFKDYSLVAIIGTGSYATVYKAERKTGSKDVVAIKCVEKSILEKPAMDKLITEISLLKVLKHEHLVEMKDFFWDERRIYIVMEYCDGGAFSEFIKEHSNVTENVWRGFFQHIGLALRYLRDHNVCHMDLKPKNLFLVEKPRLKLKVGNFGFAQYLTDTDHKYPICGSPLYTAPEILLKPKYDARVDLWSMGVIMYECLFGKAPYYHCSLDELTNNTMECRPIEIPKIPRVSDACKSLLLSLLKHDPEHRITFESFFSHVLLDLEHAPVEENYEKAAKLVQEAVKMDAEKKMKEACDLYEEALRYLMPLLRRTLGKSTPGMVDALKIGEAGEQYFREGNYALAAEKFQSSLSVLLPLLAVEPLGRRRDLLYKQVTLWMKTAENTKGLTTTTDADFFRRDNTQCVIQ